MVKELHDLNKILYILFLSVEFIPLNEIIHLVAKIFLNIMERKYQKQNYKFIHVC